MSGLIILAYINLWGLFGLSAAMPKHQKQMFAQQLSLKQTRQWQILGWISIVISCILAIWQSNWTIGLSYILGMISFNALLITWCLNYYPNKLLKLIYALGVIFVVAVFVYMFN